MRNFNKFIKNTMIKIWEKDIIKDYNDGMILKEDTLKNALYFHLRRRIGEKLKKKDIMIFTEFSNWKFKGSNKIPDMVIAKVDFNNPSEYLGDCITDCLAVIEIKFKSRFTDIEKIYSDFSKINYYATELNIKSNYFMVTIWEQEDTPSNYERKNSAWAKDILTELNASYIPGKDREIQFYHYEH